MEAGPIRHAIQMAVTAGIRLVALVVIMLVLRLVETKLREGEVPFMYIGMSGRIIQRLEKMVVLESAEVVLQVVMQVVEVATTEVVVVLLVQQVAGDRHSVMVYFVLLLYIPQLVQRAMGGSRYPTRIQILTVLVRNQLRFQRIFQSAIQLLVQ